MTKRLLTGEGAPDFTVRDTKGKAFHLKACLKSHDSFVLLAFLRYAGCPWCNLALHRLALEHRMLTKQNCEVVAFVQSSAGNIEKYIYDRHAVRPKFRIIPDLDRSTYNKYGIETSLAAIPRSLAAIPAWVHSVKSHGFKQGSVDGSKFLVPATFLISPRQKIFMAHYGSNFFDHATFTSIYELLNFDA